MSRILSLVLVLAYVVYAGVAAGLVSAFKLLAILLVPLACVWFPEAMGDYTGGIVGRGVSRQSPSAFVWFLGWVVLLLPILIGMFLWVQGSPMDASLS